MLFCLHIFLSLAVFCVIITNWILPIQFSSTSLSMVGDWWINIEWNNSCCYVVERHLNATFYAEHPKLGLDLRTINQLWVVPRMGGTSCLPQVTQDRVFELAQTRASKIGIKWLELLVWGTFLERSIDYMSREGIWISLVCPGLQLQRVIQFYHHALTVVFKIQNDV